MKVIHVIFDDYDEPLIGVLAVNDDEAEETERKILADFPGKELKVEIVTPTTLDVTLKVLHEILDDKPEPKISFLDFLKSKRACHEARQFVEESGSFSAAWDAAQAGISEEQMRRINNCSSPTCTICPNERNRREVGWNWINWLKLTLSGPVSTKEEVIERLRGQNVDV